VIRVLAPIVAIALLACACSSDDGDNAGESPTPDLTSIASVEPTSASGTCVMRRPATSGDSPGTIASGGVDRTYLLHIPEGYDGSQQLPLVVVYQGLMLDAGITAGYTRLSALADTETFGVVYLNAAGDPATWNINQAIDQPDDVAFTTDVLDRLEADLCIDPDRVFLAGYSNGGGMAQRAACELSDRIAALATVAAIYNECQAPVPWVAFHGLADPVALFEGGQLPPERGGGTLLGARRTISEWARGLGCDGLAIISRPATGVELSTYVNCATGDGEVLQYSLVGAGHTWPGSTELPSENLGETSQQIDATATIWDFFTSHPRIR
jgi:polyhydroxybutyrate depolymerase